MSPASAVAVLALASAMGPPATPAAVALEPLDGQRLRTLRANEGEKLRLISVWASWCGPCVVEMPDLAALARAFPGARFEVVTVSIDELGRHEEALTLLRRYDIPATHYRFTGEPAAVVVGLDPSWDGALPFALLVAPGGRILMRGAGLIETDRLKRTIKDWLATPTRAKRHRPTGPD